MKLIVLISFVLLILSCKNVQKQNVTSNQFLKQDSIEILLHTEKKLDTLTEVREVFLDYKIHSKYKEELYKADSLFLGPLYGASYIERPKSSGDSGLIKNPYKNLFNTYITISKLKGSYILFAQGTEDLELTLAYMRDTTLTFLDMMGWFVKYYNKVEMSNNTYKIDYRGLNNDSTLLEIKIIDKANNIQVWKRTFKNDKALRTYYDLKAPLSYALKLPILVISNSLGLDTEYNGIDNIDLERLFNE